ncbi:hypothetical protein BAUCODRAFT_574236 [Baudoinia panamericana UAMH 10762]|uniref:Uncharacterized protein n=1 Tax=Baudoinia panamericana (strain UAMH 10762) TaxID=717646 RepID=M2N2J0_BAUPA|nr:uncharacterized protein BAUCODRAFT_574236 [Baudoinia panamericana UAMH 10762]EMC98148.1 hypothetical protein BAUCODRAFT_574236 [Baudoinia panamericana UAMH 10762]
MLLMSLTTLSLLALASRSGLDVIISKHLRPYLRLDPTGIPERWTWNAHKLLNLGHDYRTKRVAFPDATQPLTPLAQPMDAEQQLRGAMLDFAGGEIRPTRLLTKCGIVQRFEEAGMIARGLSTCGGGVLMTEKLYDLDNVDKLMNCCDYLSLRSCLERAVLSWSMKPVLLPVCAVLL